MKLRTFGLALIGAAGLVILPACKKDEAPPAPSTPTTAGQAQTPTPAPAVTTAPHLCKDPDPRLAAGWVRKQYCGERP